MATHPFFVSNGAAAFRLCLGSVTRTLQTWSQELDRAVAAAHRYEQLRISCGTGAPRDRASNARQVYAELYDDRHMGTTCDSRCASARPRSDWRRQRRFVRTSAPMRASLPAILVFAFASLTALAIVSAAFAGDDRDEGTVRVMTRNLYHGFDPAIIVTAPALQIPFAAATTYQMIQNSKPAERATAVAREIVRSRADLVGLQEATIIRKGPLQLPPNPATFLPATEVVTDNLELLLAALETLGERYHVVAIVPGLDAQLPTILGHDARVTLRDVIIARSNSSLKLSNVQMQGFLINRTFPTASGAALPNPRGWVSVDVEKDGRSFRFANVHLEEPHPVQTPQAHDMIHGAGNTTLPVVFVGDFNVAANSGLDPTFPVYQKFINAGFVEAWPLKRAPDPGLTCCQAANLLNPTSQVDRRIDLILFRGAIEVVDIRLVGEKPSDRTPSGLWPSDHAGVVATLKIPKKSDL